MNARDIVEKYLKDNGYDGLSCPGEHCGCELADLVPCGDVFDECEAGYKVPCNCDGDHDFHIGPNKPEAVPPRKFKCACGWKGLSDKLVPNSSDINCCPDCGGSGGLVGDEA